MILFYFVSRKVPTLHHTAQGLYLLRLRINSKQSILTTRLSAYIVYASKEILSFGSSLKRAQHLVAQQLRPTDLYSIQLPSYTFVLTYLLTSHWAPIYSSNHPPTQPIIRVSSIRPSVYPPSHSPIHASILKGKAFPLQAWTGPWGSRKLRLQNF